MKTSLLLSLLASTVLLSACGSAQTTIDTSKKLDDVTPTKAEVAKKTIAQSLKDLIASGTAQKCIWNVDENGQKMSGTMLISGKKFKQNITITGEKGDLNTTVISDGVDFYSWSDNSKGVGIKMNLAEAQKNAPTPGQKSESAVSWDKQYNYDCSPTTVADADFALPTDVTFTDLSATLKQLQGGKMDLEQIKKLQEQYAK